MMFGKNLLLRDRRLWLLLLAALLLALSFAQPTLTLPRASYRYVFVFDITESMNVRDSGANGRQSRLDAARQAVDEALLALAQSCTNQVGLALFSAHRTLLLFEPVEVCSHLHELRKVVTGIGPQLAWESRSEVAKGLYSGLVIARQLPEPTRLVFLTDGHEAPPLNLELQPVFNKGKPGDIAGLIVGVGGAVPAPIPKLDDAGNIDGYWGADEVQQVDTASLGRPAAGSANVQLAGIDIGEDELQQRIAAGSEHLSALREDYLKRLADETRLGYYRLVQPQDLVKRLLAGDFAEYLRVSSDVRWLYGALALLLLLAVLLFDQFRRIKNTT
jgi:mxaL protein